MSKMVRNDARQTARVPDGRTKAPPPRPAMRTSGLGQPTTVEAPDTSGVIRRSVYAALRRSPLVAALWPSETNRGEYEALGNPSVRHHADAFRPIEQVVPNGDNDAFVYFNNLREPWAPARYERPPQYLPGGADAVARYQSVNRRTLSTGYEISPRTDPEPVWSPQAMPDARGVDSAPARDREWNPQIDWVPRPGFIGLPGRIPAPPQPVAVPDLWETAVPGGVPMPGPAVHPGLIVSVNPSEQDGPVFRIRPKLHRLRSVTGFRYRDTKFGRSLVGTLNSVVNTTYGVISEAADAAEVFSWSVYGLHNGRVVHAMALEDGNALAVMQGFMEGDYRVDAVGFAMDYAVMQVEDMAYGLAGRAQMAVANRLAPDGLGYKAQRQHDWAQRMSPRGDDYVAEGISTASGWLSSFDVRRQSRVRGLFS